MEIKIRSITSMALVSSRPFPFLIFLLNLSLISHHGTNAQQNFLKIFCGNRTTDTSNSTYQTNLATLLLSISTTQIDYGFYNFSYGNNSDKVNAIALCRGDVTVQDCLRCLSDSRVVLPRVCPNVRESIGWYDDCFLRYSNRTIFGLMETSPMVYLWNTKEASDKEQFMSVATQMYNNFLIERAASGNSTRKFAAAYANATSNQTIYGYAQCTPDLSTNDCRICLNAAMSQVPKCCGINIGARVATPSCQIHYESDNFIDTSFLQPFTALMSPPSAPPPPPPPPPLAQPISKQGKSNTTAIVIAIVVPTVVIIAVLIFIVIIKARRLKNIGSTEDKDDIITADSLQMDFETIRVATNDFSEANKLGQGGLGPVYLGRLFNGEEIVVKRLSKDSGQGDIEFKNEMLLVAKLHHRNLVKLLGFCLENEEKILIYEFVHNRSLDCNVFDPIKREQLNWEKRYKIIEGIARGLQYLHQDSRIQIVHRDLKASNILLDQEMNVKISDFGMARLFVVGQTHGNTSTIVGTYGYMSPEYVMHGIFSTKSDVFSFGVLILEIVSGKKNTQFHNGENAEHIISVAWKNWQKGTLINIVDPTLMEDARSRNEIMRCIHIGLLCVQEDADDRPTMASIVTMLSTYSITLPVPSEPSFYIWRSLPAAIKSSSSGDQYSTYELSISEQYPR